ncbi:MAG: aldehyde dehydrogenase [Hyphomicrobiaceae bacterium]
MTSAFDPASLSLASGHFIAGRLVEDRGEIAVDAPSDGRRLTLVPRGGEGVVANAVEAARRALARSGWGECRPRDRVKALHAWADLIANDSETLACLEAVSSTRPHAHVPGHDIAATTEQIRFFAEFADKEGGLLAPTAAGQAGFVMDQPYGVVGAIAPWNFPINMAGWKVAPALAAGNAVVLKPSEMTPFSSLRLAELAVAAGIPAGLFNVVVGDGAVTGAALCAHPGVDKISFTGSTRAGGQIMENVARSGMKPMTLELGGKSPMVVFADADIDLAVACLEKGIIPNAGQFCVAGSRMVVAREIAAEVMERLIARFGVHVPTPTWAKDAGLSPIISERQLGRLDSIVAAAVASGATTACGGQRFDCAGSYYRPTLLTDVRPDNPAVVEEIFGPVATFQVFDSEDEAEQLARHPTYGLCAGLFTRDLSRALRFARRLETGTVWINRYNRSGDHILPTGGWKQSGMGKDLGREAYQSNRRTKAVLIDL